MFSILQSCRAAADRSHPFLGKTGATWKKKNWHSITPPFFWYLEPEPVGPGPFGQEPGQKKTWFSSPSFWYSKILHRAYDDIILKKKDSLGFLYSMHCNFDDKKYWRLYYIWRMRSKCIVCWWVGGCANSIIKVNTLRMHNTHTLYLYIGCPKNLAIEFKET